MATQSFLIRTLLRLMTPEEIGEIASNHNVGSYLSLNELVTERVEKKIYRNFSETVTEESPLEDTAPSNQAKILPFKKTSDSLSHDAISPTDKIEGLSEQALVPLAESSELLAKDAKDNEAPPEHKENENMSSFIMIEKARLKKSQKVLKQKEIISLYQKNSNVDVEQIKNTNNNLDQDADAGVLVNKRQY